MVSMRNSSHAINAKQYSIQCFEKLKSPSRRSGDFSFSKHCNEYRFAIKSFSSRKYANIH